MPFAPQGPVEPEAVSKSQVLFPHRPAGGGVGTCVSCACSEGDVAEGGGQAVHSSCLPAAAGAQ